MHPKLNFPNFSFKLSGDSIWDPLRKKYVPLTPEEWVRQHTIAYLNQIKGYPQGRTVSEHTVVYNGMKKRADIVIFDEALRPFFLVECKAPEIEVSQDTFYQAARYAASLKVRFLLLTNGMQHYCAEIDAESGMKFLEEIPDFIRG